jgi:hypothetical protein
MPSPNLTQVVSDFEEMLSPRSVIGIRDVDLHVEEDIPGRNATGGWFEMQMGLRRKNSLCTYLRIA